MTPAAECEDRPFLDAILLRPDDDLPRLIYADYLDETQRADRAEFIRVGCELARLPTIGQCGHKNDHERAALLRLREVQIGDRPCVPGGKRNFERWFSPWDDKFRQIPGSFGGRSEHTFSWEFRRGFIHTIRLDSAALLAHGAAILAAEPVSLFTLSDGGEVHIRHNENVIDANRQRKVPWFLYYKRADGVVLPGASFDSRSTLTSAFSDQLRAWGVGGRSRITPPSADEMYRAFRSTMEGDRFVRVTGNSPITQCACSMREAMSPWSQISDAPLVTMALPNPVRIERQTWRVPVNGGSVDTHVYVCPGCDTVYHGEPRFTTRPH